MDEKLVKPSGEGSSDATIKKLVGGWHAMQQGATLNRRERILKEQEDRIQQTKSGKTPAQQQDSNWKPGQEERSEEFSAKRAKEFLTKMTEQKRTQRAFKGTPEQCMMKIASLMGSLPEEGRKLEKGKILMVEQAGFGQYKLTYMPD